MANALVTLLRRALLPLIAFLAGRRTGRKTVRRGQSDAPDGAPYGGSAEAAQTQAKKSSPGPDAPGKPDTPAEVEPRTWRYALRRTIREFLRDQGTDIAAALTYYSVLSIFPALIALVSLLGLVGQAEATAAALLAMLARVLPPETVDMLQDPIQSATANPAAGWSFVAGLLVALWTASNYVNAFSRGLNRMYEVDEGRPIWKLRPLFYALTAALVAIVGVGALIVVLAGPMGAAVGESLGLTDTTVAIWNFARWPAVLILAILAITMLYHLTPNIEQPKIHWLSPGAVLALLVAAAATAGFSFYVANFGKYDATFGTLAGFIIFLLWLWIANIALLLGAEFDSELERGRQLQAGIEAERTIKLPPRDTRASDKRADRYEKLVAEGEVIRTESDDSSSGDATAVENEMEYPKN